MPGIVKTITTFFYSPGNFFGKLKSFSRQALNLMDSLSSSELLISDFISQRKKNIIIYGVVAALMFIAAYNYRNAKIKFILDQTREETLKKFTHAELWRRKAEVPFLQTNDFKDEALAKLIPLLEAFVRTNDLLRAYILDPESKVILAHSNSRLNGTTYVAQRDYKEVLLLMKNGSVEINKDLSDGIKTNVSMVAYKADEGLILRTSASIPYGKNGREVGIFVAESPFDAVNQLINDQKKYFPLIVMFLISATAAVVFIDYSRQVKLLKDEMADYGTKYIGPYKNLKLIGEGGMGKVYQASRILKGKGVSRRVALKVIDQNLYNKKEFLVRFNNEAQMVASLGLHRNIIGLYDFGQVNVEGVESFGLEMPFIDGITLAEAIEKYNSDITIPQTLYICLEILNGLHHAHNLKDENGNLRPVIHRDISPKNVILSNTGAVLITDFGIAKSNDMASMTLPGELLGTFTNMSPEQANGEIVDCRSDIFSLGTVMYELLFKKRLYAADEIRVLWGLVSKAKVPEISGIDKRLKSILLKSLASNPSERYQTALDMINDIKGLISDNYKEYHFDEKDMEAFIAERNQNKIN